MAETLPDPPVNPFITIQDLRQVPPKFAQERFLTPAAKTKALLLLPTKAQLHRLNNNKLPRFTQVDQDPEAPQVQLPHIVKTV